MRRHACPQCHGTDTQRECEQGQCYAEEYQRQQEEAAWNEAQRRDEDEYWQRQVEEHRQP